MFQNPPQTYPPATIDSTPSSCYSLQQHYSSYTQQDVYCQQLTNSSANVRNVGNANASQTQFNTYQPIYNERLRSNCENLSPVSFHSSCQSPAPVSTGGLTQLATPTSGQLVQADTALPYTLAPLITPFKIKESCYMPSINLDQKRKSGLLTALNGEFSVPTAKRQRKFESLEEAKTLVKEKIYRIWARAFRFFPMLKERFTLLSSVQFVCIPDHICNFILKHDNDDNMKRVIEFYLTRKKVICCGLNKLGCIICMMHLYKSPDKASLESNRRNAQCHSVPLKEFSEKDFNGKHLQPLAPLPATYRYQPNEDQALNHKGQADGNGTSFGLKDEDMGSSGSGTAERCNQEKEIPNSSMALRDSTQFIPQIRPSSPSPRPLTHRQQAANIMKLPEKATKKSSPQPKPRKRKKKKSPPDGAEQPWPDISCFNLRKPDKNAGSDEKIDNNAQEEKGTGGMALPVAAECIIISDDEEWCTPAKRPEVNLPVSNDTDDVKVTFETFVFVDGNDDLERTSAEFGLEEVKRMTFGT